MSRLTQVYRWINVLSLDVVTGAIIGALFFAEILNVTIRLSGLIALALTVWIIYTADHLRDAKSIAHAASSERHRFHQVYFNWLLALVIMAMLADSIVILFTRKPVFEWGLALAWLVVIYLIIQRYLRILKEAFVALLYTGGVLLPSLSVTPLIIHVPHILFFCQFMMVALINLLLFSWLDYEQDLIDRQPSFATISGKPLTGFMIWALSFINFSICFYLLLATFHVLPVLLLEIMNLLLVAIFVCAKKFEKRNTFRLLGDAVFFIPVIYLLWIIL